MTKNLKQIYVETMKKSVEESVVREVIETKNFALLDNLADE